MSLADLQAKFKGDLVLPSDPRYNDAIARWATNSTKKAGLVAFVRDANDVSLAIKYAKSLKLDIAIKCGGHHAGAASSTDGGLVIDLSHHLNTVRVDPERRLAYVGGGSLLEAVDKAAIEHGLATVVGTINHTGVGGLISGGGYGFQTPRHGLAIDNLVQATVVTADGSILTANEQENADLFWGIRGAGSNFGVITEFVLRLHPQSRTILCGVLLFPHETEPKLAALIEAWWDSNPSENEVIYHAIAPDAKPLVGVILVYNGPAEEGRAKYKAFYELKPIVDTTAEIPYETLNGINNPMAAHGLNRYLKSVYFTKSLRPLMPQMISRVLSLNEGPVKFTVFQEYFVGGKVSSVPRDATAFFHRDRTCHMVVLATWTEDSQQNLETARRECNALLSIVADQEKTQVDLCYGNYTVESNASSAHLQFGDNYPRLQKLKQKYDPEVLFNKWYAITPSA